MATPVKGSFEHQGRTYSTFWNGKDYHGTKYISATPTTSFSKNPTPHQFALSPNGTMHARGNLSGTEQMMKSAQQSIFGGGGGGGGRSGGSRQG